MHNYFLWPTQTPTMFSLEKRDWDETSPTAAAQTESTPLWLFSILNYPTGTGRGGEDNCGIEDVFSVVPALHFISPAKPGGGLRPSP
ncbi:hypothetical protein DdX_03520 [Ditylenchus destructor]|uniref:Uncharacterized protein n=1 Tax=Ditylenchus destructor TaxID=166010 RepID=A0AAD4NCM8_9BILA|nr:hypothetical protein DdX_03520 [Ditylenchus destructor]